MTVQYTPKMLLGMPTVGNSYQVWGSELNTLIGLIDEAVFSNNFGEESASHTGLNFYYRNGRVQNGNTTTNVAAGYVTLTDNNTNYIEVNLSGTVSANTTGFTDGSIPLYTVVTSSGSQATATDKRCYFHPPTSQYWSYATDSINTTYNLMIGTGVKKDWDSTYNYMQLGGNGSIAYSKTAGYPSYLYISDNLYYDATDGQWEVIYQGYTSQMVLTNGRVYVYTGDFLAADSDASLLITAVFDEARNLLLGGATTPQIVADSASGCISLGADLINPTQVVANQVDLFGTDSTDTTLGILCEQSVDADTDETQFSHKWRVEINGTAYYIMLIQV
jgi:hypothetical protein